MTKEAGRSPSGRATHEPSPTVSAVPVSVPSAARWPSGYADAFIQFTPGQEAALDAYDRARRESDDQAVRETRYHLDAWDRHYGRESTVALRDRRNAALQRWGAYIFADGAGI